MTGTNHQKKRTTSTRTLKKAAEKLQTPFYLYDEEALFSRMEQLRTDFSAIEGFCPFFPVRMNCNPAILRILQQQGWGVLCSSEAELLIAERCGFSGEKICYSAFFPAPQAEALAKKLDTTWVINGEESLPGFAPKRAILVYAYPGKLMAPGGRCVARFDRSKFGMPEQELFDMVYRLRDYGTEQLGLALKIGDQEAAEGYAGAAAKALMELAVHIYEKTGVRIDRLQLAGGFRTAYRPEETDADMALAAEEILREEQRILFSAGWQQVQIDIAPGRWLMAHIGSFVTKIAAVKEHRGKKLLIADAQSAQIPHICAVGTHREMTVLGKKTPCDMAVFDIAGSADDCRDMLCRSVLLPQCTAGDYLCILDTGADGKAMQSSYGGAEDCAEYLLRGSDLMCIYKPITTRQRIEQLLESCE